jgi:RNA-directed DNA polymerase
VSSPTVTTQLQQSAEQAARAPDRGFWTLAHLSDEDLLREASRPTSKSRAAGVDGVTAPQAAPVERGWMETEDGRQRPLGTPTVEEKIVQRAGARRLEAIDAQDF